MDNNSLTYILKCAYKYFIDKSICFTFVGRMTNRHVM